MEIAPYHKEKAHVASARDNDMELGKFARDLAYLQSDGVEKHDKDNISIRNMDPGYHNRPRIDKDGMDSLLYVYIDMPPIEASCNSMTTTLATCHSWVLSEPTIQVVGQTTRAPLSQVMANGIPPDAAPWLMALVKTTTLVAFACTFVAVHHGISHKVSSVMEKLGAIATALVVILSMGMALLAALWRQPWWLSQHP